MKIDYFTMVIDFSEESDSIFLGGSGINIEFKLSTKERIDLWNSLQEIKNFPEGEYTVMNLIPAGSTKYTDKFIQLELLKDNSKSSIETFWYHINDIFLKPYRILLAHAGDTEKQRKALRDFFKPVRFRLRSIQSIMEGENRIVIDNVLLPII